MDNASLINQIVGRGDYVFGRLCSEAQYSYNQGYHFSALACVFVLAEHSVKATIDSHRGGFRRSINRAYKQKIIDAEEFQLLNKICSTRDILFHESHYSAALEMDDGTLCLLSEEDSLKPSMNSFLIGCFPWY